MPEIRIDPLSGHRTIIAGERSRRPGGAPALSPEQRAPEPIDPEQDPFAEGHEDRTPSCRLYETSFYCFGCHAGGDIFTFASHLYGILSHGSSFPELRERLADHLLGVAA